MEITQSTLDKIYDLLNYKFKNCNLLINALTHPSNNVKIDPIKSYQRLEFLGDKLLNMVVADLLYKNFPSDSECDLSRRLSYLICKHFIAKIALNINIGEYIIFTGQQKDKHIKSSLEDVLEAVIAAIYLDSDFHQTYKFISSLWEKHIKNTTTELPPVDAKTQLQEWTQNKQLGLPQYYVLEQTGTEHDPTFHILVKIDNLNIEATGTGSSKKIAGKNAAKNLYNKLKNYTHKK